MLESVDEPISAADANRNFSSLLRQVRQGLSFVVTSHGRPVARIVPALREPGDDAALRALMARLDEQPATEVGNWTREELYDEPRKGP